MERIIGQTITIPFQNACHYQDYNIDGKAEEAIILQNRVNIAISQLRDDFVGKATEITATLLENSKKHTNPQKQGKPRESHRKRRRKV